MATVTEKHIMKPEDKVNQARYALMNDQLLPVRGKRNRFADYCNEWTVSETKQRETIHFCKIYNDPGKIYQA